MDNWDFADIGLLLGALTSTYRDVQRSKRALNDPNIEERNPLASGKPTDKAMDKLGVLGALAGTGTALTLPNKWRKPFLVGWGTMEEIIAQQAEKRPHGKNFFDSMAGPALFGLMAAGLTYGIQNDYNIILTPTGLSFTKKF